VLVFILFLALLSITLVFYLIIRREEKEKIEFFHVTAHKFRSPIAIIKWYLELLSKESVGNLNNKQKEYFAEMYNASEKLNEKIDSIIVLLQLQSNKLTLKREKVNVKDLLTQIIQKLQFKIERHKLHLQETYPKEEVIIQADSRLLNIVFQNILENAIKYTPENGNIDIKVNLIEKKLLIEIEDSGYGIPKERKSKILADSVNSKNMGFSLYFVKLILKKMKAHINFRSEENKGTTFSISMPI